MANRQPTRQGKVHSTLGHRFGYVCHQCGSRYNVQLHHIAERGWSRIDSETREKSECVELMIFLCEHCHAEARENIQAILKIKVKQYGAWRIQEAIDRVNAAAGRVLITLEETDENETT